MMFVTTANFVKLPTIFPICRNATVILATMLLGTMACLIAMLAYVAFGAPSSIRGLQDEEGEASGGKEGEMQAGQECSMYGPAHKFRYGSKLLAYKARRSPFFRRLDKNNSCREGRDYIGQFVVDQEALDSCDELEKEVLVWRAVYQVSGKWSGGEHEKVQV